MQAEMAETDYGAKKVQAVEHERPFFWPGNAAK